MSFIPRRYDIDNFFDRFFETPVVNQMKCDIYEKDGDYHIVMDIPGFNKEDIHVEIKDDYLVITAESTKEQDQEEKNYIRRERSFGKIQRSFYVGNLNNEDIKAKFQDGTLTVIVPKAEEQENKRNIEIEG